VYIFYYRCIFSLSLSLSLSHRLRLLCLMDEQQKAETHWLICVRVTSALTLQSHCVFILRHRLIFLPSHRIFFCRLHYLFVQRDERRRKKLIEHEKWENQFLYAFFSALSSLLNELLFLVSKDWSDSLNKDACDDYWRQTQKQHIFWETKLIDWWMSQKVSFWREKTTHTAQIGSDCVRLCHCTLISLCRVLFFDSLSRSFWPSNDRTSLTITGRGVGININSFIHSLLARSNIVWRRVHYT